MKWHKCSEEIPGQENDYFFNDKLSPCAASNFLVCFNHGGGDEPWLCRAYLKEGKFIIDEYCHYYNEEEYEACKDPEQ